MCGIVGFYSKTDNFVSKEELNSMTDSLQHRGPDASGTYFTPNVGLGHRRLSIIDLSSDAHQPMESHTMRYTCVFNGEIYNYKAIAQELGLHFKTNCDTEVVLEAFAEWGVTFVNKLNGMFAIVIYDKQEKILYIFRDRIGVKPLYYYWDGKNFAFASEIKALLKINHIRTQRQIDQQSVLDYLHLGYIPEPNSIYKNIFKFPSGNIGIVSSSGFRIETYWHIEGVIRRKLIEDEAECRYKLRELVESSVSMRLIGDIPYGTLLSGGVDSSLVTAVAAKMTGKNLNTFSIGIEDSKVDESRYARKVAKFLNTNHHELMLTESDAKIMMLDMLDYFDEPFGDSSAIPTMLVSKFAREHVGMVLSGDGGDELFHGYGAYKWARRLSYTNNRTLRQFLSFVLTQTGTNKYKRAAQLFQYKQQKHLKSHIFSQEQYLFSIQEINKLMQQQNYFNTTVDQDFSYFVRKLTPEEDQAIFDLKYYLKDDLLVKVDRSSMKYSLETRTPLLDYRIIEFALNISPKLKIQSGIQKYLLKEVLYGYLPRDFFDRPKWGFSIPLSTWLMRDMSYLINEYLNEWIIRKHKIVNFEETQKLINSFRNGTDYLYNRIWLLIILHSFMENDKKLY